MDDLQVVVFKLGEQSFGVDTVQVQEIIRYQDVEKIPGMPEYMGGMINLRGNVIPIINLHKRFGMDELQFNNVTKIIVTNLDGRFVGFIVDDVTEIVKFMGKDIEQTPEILNKSINGYLSCVAKKDEQLISIINLSKVLSEDEVEEVVETITA